MDIEFEKNKNDSKVIKNIKKYNKKDKINE